jgi:hypothetical protein
MENKKLYYTPKIEDIRVGYQCEIKDYHSNPFTPYTFSESDFAWGDSETFETDFNRYTKDDMINIRTPYLTKEDIESCGWTNNGTNDGYKTNFSIIGSKSGKIEFGSLFELEFFIPVTTPWIIIKHNYCYIENGKEYNKTDICYTGRCKSINEFKYITEELLNIK